MVAAKILLFNLAKHSVKTHTLISGKIFPHKKIPSNTLANL